MFFRHFFEFSNFGIPKYNFFAGPKKSLKSHLKIRSLIYSETNYGYGGTICGDKVFVVGSGGREIDKIDMDGSNKVRICTGYCSNDVRTGTITSDGTYIYALSQHATYLLGYTIFRISPDRGGEALSDSDVWHTYNTPLLRDGEERGMSCVPFKGIYYQRGIYHQQN